MTFADVARSPARDGESGTRRAEALAQNRAARKRQDRTGGCNTCGSESTATGIDSEEAESIEEGDQLKDLNTPENQMMSRQIADNEIPWRER